MIKHSILAGLTGLAFVAGCVEDRHIGWERDRAVIGPVPLKDKLAYVDTARDRVVVLDTSPATPRVEGFAIGRRAIYATPTPDREHLAVITRGEEAVSKGQVDQDPSLWIVDVNAPNAAPIEYPIGSPFDRLAISRDGSVAIAYFSGAGPDEEGFFRNPNELAVVHLDRPPGPGNPAMKTVRSFGSVPDGVVLSPPMVLPGAEDPSPRIFAFILALNNVTVIDATYPDRNEVSIRLDSAGVSVRPREMVFAPATATAYLRSDNARDVLEIILSYDPPDQDNPKDNDYRPALAELGAGGGPSDIAVYDDASARRFVLAATPGTREVVIIDADTAQFATVSTPDPIDRIILFPNDADAVPKTALLASIGGQSRRVHLLSLEGLTEDLVRAQLETITLDEPVLDVVPVPGRELAMVVHSDDRTVLGLLDIRFGSVSPLQGVGRLDTYDFTADGAYLIGASPGIERVGFLELDNLHPSDMRLDDPPSRVFALPGGAVVVDHGDPFGRATVLPYPGAARIDSFVVAGFLLDDLLGQEF